MAQQTYTVRSDDAEIRIRAGGHSQHVWSSTTLLDVSAAGARRLAALRAQATDPLRVEIAGRTIRLDGWILRAA